MASKGPRSKLDHETRARRQKVFDTHADAEDEPNMKPKQLRVLGTGAALFLGGILSLNVVSSVTLATLRSVTEARRKKLASPCVSCKGKGFYVCKLCGGNAAIHWSPLRDPIAINPCVCPTCDGNRIQRCLNCLGKGYR